MTINGSSQQDVFFDKELVNTPTCTDDTWTATSITNAPDGRMLPTAVWTGSEMIVWGGTTDRINGLNTGGRYNPSTDSWTPTSTTNAPTARFAHTAVWTGSEMIVWGGYNNSSSLEHRREIRSEHGQLDCYQHHQCARWPIRSHGGLDRQRNDRLGRTQRHCIFNTGGRYNPVTDTLDRHQHHWRAHCPRRSHGSVDRQRNDRLGRT